MEQSRDASYGFRPGRSPHQAVRRAQEHVGAGFGIVVDLEKFFDRVNHDILMGLVARRMPNAFFTRLGLASLANHATA